MPTRRPLDRDELRIRNNLLQMGSMVGSAIERAVHCLTNQNSELAQQIISQDEAINELERKVEEECLITLATQQPVARELREILAAMHIAVELERMADYAAGIAKIELDLGQRPLPKLMDEIAQMAEQCRAMLSGVLEAYAERDPEKARAVAAEDQTLDQRNKQLVGLLLAKLSDDLATAETVTRLLWVVHHLERVGDRVTNIAERVVFMTTGAVQELN